jgi:hypothetical protein
MNHDKWVSLLTNQVGGSLSPSLQIHSFLRPSSLHCSGYTTYGKGYGIPLKTCAFFQRSLRAWSFLCVWMGYLNKRSTLFFSSEGVVWIMCFAIRICMVVMIRKREAIVLWKHSSQAIVVLHFGIQGYHECIQSF